MRQVFGCLPVTFKHNSVKPLQVRQELLKMLWYMVARFSDCLIASIIPEIPFGYPS